MEGPHEGRYETKFVENITKFAVPEMTCGHCTAAIEKSVSAVDPAAKVACDLETHQVEVVSARDVVEITAAIKDAGYASQPIA